jgi:hypothetical protein
MATPSHVADNYLSETWRTLSSSLNNPKELIMYNLVQTSYGTVNADHNLLNQLVIPATC